MSFGDHVNILGTRGVPAAHGGFETFAERFALYLVTQGRTVTVYCQSESGQDLHGREDVWQGVHRVHFGTRLKGAAGTIEFDLKCVRHVLNRPGVDLVLGYNTALLNVAQRLRGRRIFMNLDGIEWKRQKWSVPEKLWLKFNEYVGAKISTVPIADHPEIARHIRERASVNPVMIPYGADVVGASDDSNLKSYGLSSDSYFISVARIEPENSILEIVEAYELAAPEQKLLVLGKIDPSNPYHQKVINAAGEKVLFPGGIYDDLVVKSLRFHARAYFHGHQVGGTNPSLVEALGAGNAVIAHDNRFNRWTAGSKQLYFDDVNSCVGHIRRLASDDLAVYAARKAAREQHRQNFRWNDVLAAYGQLLSSNANSEAKRIAAE